MQPSPPGANEFHTREEFRAWCAAWPAGRYERIDGRIVAIAPERGAHLRVKAATWLALRQAIAAAGVACQALPDGAAVETGESDYEPDALVNCGQPMTDDAVAAPNPVVVVEVLSPGTAAADTGGKLADYFQVASVSHYLIAHATKRLVVQHSRTPGGIDTRIVASGSIVLDPPGIAITVEKLYE